MGNRLPLGFDSFEQFHLFCRELILAIAAEGARAEAWIIGTAATGFSMNLAKPQGHAFSKNSDIDVVLRSLELLQKMKEAGGKADTSWHFLGKHLWLLNDGQNGFLSVCPHVAEFASKWSKLLPVPVDVRLFIGVRGLMTHVDEFLELQNPIELWPQSIYETEPERNEIEIGMPCRVTVTSDGLHIDGPNGQSMGLGWHDLDSVAIRTTTGGSGETDVFWVLGSGDTCVLIAQGATGEQALVDKLVALSGFDHEAMIAAMSCTEDREFACWARAR